MDQPLSPFCRSCSVQSAMPAMLLVAVAAAVAVASCASLTAGPEGGGGPAEKASAGAPADEAPAVAQLELAVTVTEDCGRDVPVCARIEIPGDLRDLDAESISVTMRRGPTGHAEFPASLPGQIVKAGDGVELWWIMPALGQVPGTTRWVAELSPEPFAGDDCFAFTDEPGGHLDLSFAGRKLTRYMYAFDRSTPERAFETYKVYHHVFDAAGRDMITKGAPGHDPHHRGIYIGWNKLAFGGKRYDIWSMKNGCAQFHVKFLAKSAGPVLGRAVALIEWRDGSGRTIVSEERETVCFRVSSGRAIMLMEFRSRLTAVAGDLVLDGNAEHGGFQYRAHDEVAVNAGAGRGKQTADAASRELKTLYEFHRDGIGTGGQKLNDNRDLPWAAMSYALRGRRYVVQHVNHETNPKGTVYSAYRPYGRFGAYFKKALRQGEVLAVRYRLCVSEGPFPPRDEMIRRHAAFNRPPEARVVE